MYLGSEACVRRVGLWRFVGRFAALGDNTKCKRSFVLKCGLRMTGLSVCVRFDDASAQAGGTIGL